MSGPHGEGFASAAEDFAGLTNQIAQSERQLAEIDGQIAELRRDLVTEADVIAGFADFGKVWTALNPSFLIRWFLE